MEKCKDRELREERNDGGREEKAGRGGREGGREGGNAQWLGSIQIRGTSAGALGSRRSVISSFLVFDTD